jgi:hypothetical protein
VPQLLLIINHQLRSPAGHFREHARKAAAGIRKSTGLGWKIWRREAASGRGISAHGAHVFSSRDLAQAFIKGENIAARRADPAVSQVRCREAPVEQPLSLAIGAGTALGVSER